MTDIPPRPQPRDDAALDAFFDAARTTPELTLEAETDFMARVLAQAHAAQPAPGRAPAAPWWQWLSEPFGGLGALSGLVAAAATGVMIGISPPAALTDGLGDAGLLPAMLQSTDLEYEIGMTALFEEN